MSEQYDRLPQVHLDRDNVKLLRMVQSATHCKLSLARLVNQAVEVYWSDYALKRSKKNTNTKKTK